MANKTKENKRSTGKNNVHQDHRNGSYYFSASLGYDETGKRVRVSRSGFATQREAKMAYIEFMNNYSKTGVKMNSTMSFKEFYETYYEPDYRSSVSQATFDNRQSSMLKHFAYFYNTQLKDITPIMVKKWQNELSKKYSSAYIRNIFGALQRCLDLAVQLGLLQNNVAKTVGNVKKTKQIVDFWTFDEFKKVIATFNTDNYYELFGYTIIYVLFMTGLRIGEAMALKWDTDINFEDKTLTVNKSMYYKSSTEFYINPPKTKAGNRVIALDDTTIDVLRKWKEVQSKNVGSEYVLSPNPFPTNKSFVSNKITKHSKLAEVHRIKTHALRHSHASLLISLGENALIIRDRLGHEDVETTLATYGHLYPNTNKDVANKLYTFVSTSN